MTARLSSRVGEVSRYGLRWLAVFLASGTTSMALAAPSPAEEAAESRQEGGRANEERARLAFEEGKALVAAGDYQRACQHFEYSLSLLEGIGTLYNLADCLENLGRTASAHALFTRAAVESARAAQYDRSALARARADALERRQAELLIELDSPVGDLTIRSGERVIRPNTRTFVDPGVHFLSASARGKKPWSRQVTIPPGPALVSMTLPSLEPIDTAAPAADGLVTSRKAPSRRGALKSSSATVPKEPLPMVSKDGGFRPVPVIIGGAGIAALAAGTVFAIRYKQKDDEARAICPGATDCSSGEIERHAGLRDEAKEARLLSYVGFGAGAAAVGTAIWLLLSDQDSSEGLRAGAMMDPAGSWAATVAGSF